MKNVPSAVLHGRITGRTKKEESIPLSSAVIKGMAMAGF
jgi:hypothetical protein